MIIDRFGAMGTQIEAHGSSHRDLDRLRAWFETVEDACSRFRPHSELNGVNAAAGSPTEVSPLLASVLHAAVRAGRLTGGLVDPAVGARVAAWGYDRTFGEVSGLDRPPAPGAAGRWRVEGRIVTLAPGTRLDLGGIAKGWACDRAVEMGLAAVVSAGGDLRSADADTNAEVVSAFGEVVAVVPVGVGALATSSTARRRWRAGDRDVSHLVDPRTGDPVDSPVVSASAAAATALEAEAAAKAVVLLGAAGLVWADTRPWIRFSLAEWRDGSAYATGGLAA